MSGDSTIDLLLRPDLSLRVRRVLFKESSHLIGPQLVRDLLAWLLRLGLFEENRTRRLLGRLLQQRDVESRKRLILCNKNFKLLFGYDIQQPRQPTIVEPLSDWVSNAFNGANAIVVDDSPRPKRQRVEEPCLLPPPPPPPTAN